jgi:hypothetical protein
MEICGKVHLMFEQSGVFKNEFKKLGYEAFDYDIQNNFGETDYQIDLFKEIKDAYDGRPSLFDSIRGQEDLIFAFFPCIYFCDAKVMFFRGVHNSQQNKALHEIMDWNIEESQTRERYFQTLMKLVSVVSRKGLRLIIENPWNTSQGTYLQTNFIAPTMVDNNRAIRGDYYVKPTAYWFINCKNTYGFSEQRNSETKIVYKGKDSKQKGICSEERSMISPDYARNFICDFTIGKEQLGTQLNLF